MRVLIVTCDKSAWAVPWCLHFIEKNWPDCPWPIDVLGGPQTVETLRHNSQIRYCLPGDDETWAALLCAHLEEAFAHEPFLLLLEDYLTSDTIDTGRIELYAEILEEDPLLDFVRLNACPGPTGGPYEDFTPLACFADWNLSYFSLGQAYNVSLQPTIFRPWFLLRVLERFWGPFAVETEGTKAVNRGYPLHAIGTCNTAFPVANLIRRGVVESKAHDWAVENW